MPLDLFEFHHRHRHRNLFGEMTDAAGSQGVEWGRDSAGAPARPGGVVEFRLPGGEVIQRETFTCRHCGRPQWVPPGMTVSDIAKCFCCWGLVCHECEPLGDCKEKGEFMKQVEAAERRDRLYAAARG